MPDGSFSFAPDREVLGADLFCGAGGTSTAAEQAIAALGLKLRLVAVNHWRTAVDTHTVNHPDAIHFCQDLATLRPMVAVPGGRLDILIASPTCTYHSRARGGRPTHDQQRMDPWHVVTWLTELRVDRIFIENVPEFLKWGPVDPATGRPIKAREGEFFRAWIRTLQAIGFVVEWRIVKFAEHGDATTRERFLLMGRSDGLPLRWPDPTHGRPGTPGRKPWRTARDHVIDWTLKGKDALGRKTPLKPNTLRRIMVGVTRHFGTLAPLYLAALEVELARSIARWGDRSKTAGRKTASARTAEGAALVCLRGTGASSPVDRPAPALTAGGNHLGLVTPDAEPFLLGQHSGSTPRSVDNPAMTVAAKGAIVLTEPGHAAIIHMKGRSDAVSVDRPPPTVATKSQLGVVESLLFHVNHTDGTDRSIPLDGPFPAITGKRGFGLVTGFVLPVNQGDGRARGIRPTVEPLPTVMTRDSLGMANALLVPYYGSGSGEACTPVTVPLPTATTKKRFGVVEAVRDAILVQVDQTGSNGPCVRPVNKPLGTLVTKQNAALVEGSAEPFMVVYNEQADGRDRASHSVDEPPPTITASPRIALTEGIAETPATMEMDEMQRLADARRLAVIDGTLVVLKLPFRMLTNRELARATSFPDDYEFCGNQEEVTKQIGNAVPLRTARAHIAALFDHQPQAA